MVANHAAHVRNLTSDTKWNATAPLHPFWWGLQDEINDEIAHVLMLTSLNAFIDLASCMKEGKKKGGSLQLFYHRVVLLTPSFPTKPMQADMACQLTSEEREHQLHLCFYCRGTLFLSALCEPQREIRQSRPIKGDAPGPGRTEVPPHISPDCDIFCTLLGGPSRAGICSTAYT